MRNKVELEVFKRAINEFKHELFCDGTIGNIGCTKKKIKDLDSNKTKTFHVAYFLRKDLTPVIENGEEFMEVLYGRIVNIGKFVIRFSKSMSEKKAGKMTSEICKIINRIEIEKGWNK